MLGNTPSRNTTVPLTKGEKFAVVIKLTTLGGGYPVPMHEWISGYDDSATDSKRRELCKSRRSHAE
jgi:hypothetical protein